MLDYIRDLLRQIRDYATGQRIPDAWLEDLKRVAERLEGLGGKQ